MENAVANDTEGIIREPPSPDRIRIVLSFWLVVLIGLPFWWSTTAVERHPLPEYEVAALARQQPCPLELPVLLDFGGSSWPALDPGLTIRELNAHAATSEQWRCLRFARAPADIPSSLIWVVPNGIIDVADLKKVLMPKTTDSPDEVDARVAKYSSRYKLVYSLLWEEAPFDKPAPTWQVDAAFEKHIFPVAAALSPLFNFTVETQIQHFAPLTVETAVDESGQAIIEEDQLKAFVNSAEWNLASTASLDPALHFIVYVPKSEQPLRIRQADGELSKTNAFISPQWGGVAIVHVDHTELKAGDLEAPFALFSQQLQILLGVPTRVKRWSDRVNAMLRKTAAANARETVDTLQAIIKLANEIRNMRVARSVGKGVETAISHIQLAQNAAEIGDARAAFLHSARAHEHAEKAFFDPDMLALLYFPAEHVYAVYTPLFGPIAVPMVLSLLKEYRMWRKRKSVRLKIE